MEKTTDEIIREKLGPFITEMKNTIFEPDYRAKVTDADVLGIIVSKYLEYDAIQISECAASAFEDCNCNDGLKMMNKFTKALKL